MDFRQNSQQFNINRSEQPQAPAPNVAAGSDKKIDFDKPASQRVPFSIGKALSLGAVLLVIVMVAVVITSVAGKDESKFVDDKSYQAVFLNNGQVYFGKIGSINNRYVNMTKVYYLTQTATANGTASSDYSLIKLGCQQIHYPKDQMIISRDQVTFWENLDAKGKVANSIEDFKKQYPNGENCKTTTNETQSTNAPTQSSNNATQQTSNTTNTNNTTNTTNTTDTNTTR